MDGLSQKSRHRFRLMNFYNKSLITRTPHRNHLMDNDTASYAFSVKSHCWENLLLSRDLSTSASLFLALSLIRASKST